MPDYDATLFDPPAPIAKVTLKHSVNGNRITDVLMLLDSGADTTLVPQAILEKLDIKVDSDEIYELVTFNGAITTVSPARLDLLFLNKVFRGRYLVIESEWGIIGRDILNFVPLVFNGPALTWHEYRQSQ